MPDKFRILYRHFRVCWKQTALNGIIDIGSIVKITLLQGNKGLKTFLPIRIKTQKEGCNYFSAINAGEGA
jgi:hypothetical protein